MSKVYVVNNMTHDYTKAEKFGTLVNVTEGKMPIFKTDTMLAILKERLADFTSDDYLLISGPALMCIMVATIAFSKVNTVKVLVFDAKEQGYIVRHLDQDYIQK